MTAYLHTILYMMLLLWPAAIVQGYGAVDDRDRNVSYLDGIRFVNRDIAKGGREVSLSMDIILDSAKIKTQHTVALTPVLVSEDGKEEFPFGTVIVDGRTRHRVFSRNEALGKENCPERDSAQIVIMRKNGREQSYSYLSVIPYDWRMPDGRLELRESVRGCTGCGKGDTTAVLESRVMERFVPDWKTSRIEPSPEPVKHREESRVAQLQFRQGKHDILPHWNGNKAVLDTVTASVDLVKTKSYIVITGIYVAGFASPEGTWEYNMNLSRSRAEAFAGYIAQHNEVDTELMHVEWSGEDWNGFRAELMKSGFGKKDLIVGIIDACTDDRNECERLMRDKLTPDEYVWLKENIYPALRRCMYRVEYDVKVFDLDEARKVIYDSPADLSLQEMYMVARSYESGSDEYRYAMEMAAEHFPLEPAVLGDKALNALEASDAGAAVDALEGKIHDAVESGTGERPEMEKTAGLLNILGVAYARTGENAQDRDEAARWFDKARECFETAAGAGCADAGDNLLQVLSVLDQI